MYQKLLKKVLTLALSFLLIFPPYTVSPLISAALAVTTANVAIDNQSPTTNDTLTATVSGSDAVSPSTTYQWKLNGGDIAGATGQTLNLSQGGNGNKGDVISVAVHIDDSNDSSTFDVTSSGVTVLNSNPVGVGDTSVTNEDTQVVIAAADLISNDTDADGDTITFTGVTNGTGGTVSYDGGTGNVTFTPTANFNGSANFTYGISDGDGGTGTGTVNVTVTAVNDAPTISALSISPSSPTTASTLTANSTVNDVDGDSLTYTYQWKNGGSNVGTNASTLDLSQLGYGDKGDSITVDLTVSDGTLSVGPTTSSAVTVVNSAPVSSTQSTTTSEDTNKNITLGSTDDDSDSLTYSVVSSPSHGTLDTTNINTTHVVVYSPTANYNGSDSFTFKTNDGTVDSNTATVNITVSSVNDAPVADNVNDSDNEDTANTTTLFASDVDGDSLTYSIVAGPSNGTLDTTNINTTHDIIYTPTLNFNGTDSFTYKVNDGTVDSNTATVTLPVSAVNDAPTVTVTSPNGSENWAGGSSKNITWTSSDVDGDSLTFDLAYTTDGATFNSIAVGVTGASYTWNPVASLNSGTVLVRATANDGTTTTQDSSNASFTIDSTAPSSPSGVGATSPTSSTSQNWSWTAGTDALSGIASYLWYAEDNTAVGTTVASGTTTSSTLNVVTNFLEGVWNFFVGAQDTAGNVSTYSSGQVTVDTTAPTVSANNSSAGTWNTVNPTITLSVSDAGGAGLSASTVRYAWDGTADATTGTVFTNGTTINIPSDGTHTLNLYAADAAGNSNTFSGTYKLDTVNPTVTATGSSSSWVTTVPTIMVSASDATSGLAILKYAWDSTADATTGTDTTDGADLTSTYPGAGNHTLNIYAQDASGRSNTFAGTYKVDSTAPVISSVSINNVTTSNNTYLKAGDTVNVTATVTDTNQADITTSMLSADLSALGGGSSVPANTYNTSTGVATWSNLVIGSTASGTVSVTVSATDAATNAATPQSDTIIADNTAPTGSITTPSNGAYTNSTPTFTASASDANGVASVTFQYKTSSAGSYTTLNVGTSAPYAADWTGVTLVTNTVYNLQALVTDVAGNVTTVSGVSFTYDTTAPAITLNSPLNGTTTTSTATLSVTTNETATCTYALDGTSATPMSTTGGTSHSQPLSLLSVGTHTVQYVCTDQATNATTSSTYSWSVVASSGSTLDGSSSNITIDSGTDGQADLPSGISTLTLNNSTSLNVSGGISTAAGGSIIIGGTSVPLSNFTSGSLSGVNLSTAQTVGDRTVTVAQAVKLESGTNGQPIVLNNSSTTNVSLVIPDGTTILAPSGWNGNLTPPRVSTGGGSVPSGFSLGSTVFEFGSSDTVLLFDQAVTVLFPGVGEIAYKSAGSSTWNRITTVCAGTYASPTSPTFPGECMISNGVNTKILTYHLTSFATLSVNGGSKANDSVLTNNSTSTPSCSDQKPASAPQLLWAQAGQNSVTLTWSYAIDPVSYYLVAYGTQSGVMQYGNQNAGNRETNSYTITGLSGGKTYYFKVRAGNGCAPGEYSNELSATPTGGSVDGIAPGFAPGVLGASDVQAAEREEATPSADMSKEEESNEMKDVLGSAIEKMNLGEAGKKTTKNTVLLTLAALLAAAIAFQIYRRRK